ncbi:tetratricopeptide repeat protein [Kaarinaea lacus]
MRRIFLFTVILCFPLLSTAYQGDYVWEDKLAKLLPKAEAGNAEAQYDVGEMYERGRGVLKDAGKAFEWYLKSAQQGNEKAAYRAGLAYLKGKGTEKEHSKAFKWLSIAADKGYERAQYYVGEMYEKGLGVDKDLRISLKYYQKSQEGGFAPAVDRVARVKSTMQEEENLRNKRAEAAARKRLASNTKARARAKKVSIKAPSTTKELLLKGGWTKKNKPVEFLPSNVSSCEETAATIECMSSELKRSIGVADVTYRTKAILYGIKDSGDFKISYRNNVTAVRVTDPDFAASGKKLPVKKGWQDAEHSLTCKLDNKKQVSCDKDKIRKVTFTRK